MSDRERLRCDVDLMDSLVLLTDHAEGLLLADSPAAAYATLRTVGSLLRTHRATQAALLAERQEFDLSGVEVKET